MTGCKSAIYVANSTSQNVAVGGAINVGGVIRRFGNNLDAVNGAVYAKGCGFFKADVSVTFTGTAGTTEIVALQNGVPIPGAEASRTTAATTVYTIGFPFMFRNAGEASVITLQVNGSTAEVSNVGMTVVKV